MLITLVFNKVCSPCISRLLSLGQPIFASSHPGLSSDQTTRAPVVKSRETGLQEVDTSQLVRT